MKFTIKIPDQLRSSFGSDFSNIDALICETYSLDQLSWGNYEFEITKVNFRRRTNCHDKTKEDENIILANRQTNTICEEP